MNKTMMVFGIVASSLIASVAGANADVYVRGHVRSDGSYVTPHHRSNPDAYRSNNWTTSGNYNPYTGQQGSRNDYGSSDLLSRPTYSRSNNILAPSSGSMRLYK